MTSLQRTAALIAVGDELVSGDRADKNLAWLARELTELGWEVIESRLMGDDEDRLVVALEQLLEECALVITTGGLGPTLDDVTRHAASRAISSELEIDTATVDGLVELWRDRDGDMPEANLRQALIPAGAEILKNAHGTAPGFLAGRDGSRLACLPGPPREMRGVATDELFHRISGGCAPARKTLYLFGLSESRLADLIGAWMDRDADPQVGVLASTGVLELKFISKSGDISRLEERIAEARTLLGAWIFSEENGDLAQALVTALVETGRTVAVAESCTGGAVTQQLCGIPGVSEVLREGVVTYSNDAKMARLGVPSALLEEHGAVSEEVALAMARGLQESSGAELVGSVTGIAGPGGGSLTKPVGRIHFAVGLEGHFQASEMSFPDRGRAYIQAWSTNTLLHLLLCFLREGR
jgi:nicotinamide-nucleotide amidase